MNVYVNLDCLIRFEDDKKKYDYFLELSLILRQQCLIEKIFESKHIRWQQNNIGAKRKKNI